MGDTPTVTYDSANLKVTVRGANSFPTEVYDYADDAEILDMSEGHLSVMPRNMGRFKNLRVIFLSYNDFESVPTSLADCEKLEMIGMRSCRITAIPELPPGLRALTLTDNRLTEIPVDIGELRLLEKLMLSGNQLKTLPDSLFRCHKLSLLRLAANKLEQVPAWVYELPGLAWFTESGNAFNATNADDFDGLPTVSWDDIELGPLIEESQNKVYSARLRSGTPVAVKLYRGSLTTDGLPDDDRRISLLAGKDPHVIGAIGQLSGAPDGETGLVMPLIPKTFTKLGSRPSLKSLTRDTFPTGTEFHSDQIQKVLSGVAGALKHLHGRGIIHGDIYAHNVLVDKTAHSYLGDFGAASLYQPRGGVDPRERIDCKGFGYLIDDLLSQVLEHEDVANLAQLKAACLSDDFKNRPSFEEITHILET